MKIKLGAKAEDEIKPDKGPEEELPQDEKDDLPADDTVEDETEIEPEDDGKADDLAIQNAELRGELRALKESRFSQPSDDQEKRNLQTRQQCLSDIASLDDDTFQTRYRMNKAQAQNAVTQFDLETEQKKSSATESRLAELEAKNDLITKYPKFARLYSKVKDSALADLSLEARKDPNRLKRAFEREYLLIEKDEPASKKEKGKEEPMRRRIVNDFERPGDSDRSRKAADEAARAKNDELAPEYREVAARFGITKESERKKFSSPFIPMDLGGGYKFEDPKKGFERTVRK